MITVKRPFFNAREEHPPHRRCRMVARTVFLMLLDTTAVSSRWIVGKTCTLRARVCPFAKSHILYIIISIIYRRSRGLTQKIVCVTICHVIIVTIHVFTRVCRIYYKRPRGTSRAIIVTLRPVYFMRWSSSRLVVFGRAKRHEKCFKTFDRAHIRA